MRSTSYDEVKGELVIDFGAEPGGVPGDCVHVAYFPPYSNEAHLDLLARAPRGGPVRPVGPRARPTVQQGPERKDDPRRRVRQDACRVARVQMQRKREERAKVNACVLRVL